MLNLSVFYRRMGVVRKQMCKNENYKIVRKQMCKNKNYKIVTKELASTTIFYSTFQHYCTLDDPITDVVRAGLTHHRIVSHRQNLKIFNVGTENSDG